MVFSVHEINFKCYDMSTPVLPSVLFLFELFMLGKESLIP